MKSSTIKLVVVTGIVLGIIAILIFSKPQSDTRNSIKIGVILPMTGNQAFVGEGVTNALRLAQEKIRGGKYTYELIVEDAQLDPKRAVTAANKLITVDHVDAIIDAYALIGSVVSPIAEQNKVLHIGIAFDPNIAKGKYNFLLFTTPDTAARKLLGELQNRHINRVSVFRVNNQGILAVYQSIQKLSVEYGVSIVFDQEFQPGERDFRGLVAKSIQTHPQTNILLALPPELDILTQQLHDQNVQELTSAMYFEISPNKTLYNGLWSVGYGRPSGQFEQEYQDRYKTEYTFAGPNAYDALMLIDHVANSYTGSGKPSSGFMAQAIEGLDTYDGVLGKLKIAGGHIIDSEATIKMMRGGKLEVVE